MDFFVSKRMIKIIKENNITKMKELSVNHLLGIKYINKNDINLILETADQFKEVINRPIKKVPSLQDITIANIFFENSTRTKLSFELAQKRLSADVMSFSSGQSSKQVGFLRSSSSNLWNMYIPDRFLLFIVFVLIVLCFFHINCSGFMFSKIITEFDFEISIMQKSSLIKNQFFKLIPFSHILKIRQL
jgi:hypothetical protein